MFHRKRGQNRVRPMGDIAAIGVPLFLYQKRFQTDRLNQKNNRSTWAEIGIQMLGQTKNG